MPAGFDKVERIGPDPPDRLAELKEATERSIYRAFGIPPALFDEKASNTREACRFFRRTTIARLASVMRDELSLKLNEGANVSTDNLKASNIVAEARAIHVLTQAGFSKEDAEEMVGL